MSIPLIGLTGAAGSGKDTVAEHLTDKYGLRLFRFSAPLKDLVARMFGESSEAVASGDSCDHETELVAPKG